jgi:GxxExxY protein
MTHDSDGGDSIVEQELSYRIVNAFFEVYNALGYGLLESLYAGAMVIALEERGIRVEREVCVPVYFKGHLLGNQRLDLVVERRIILECKSTEQLSKIAPRQLRSYLAVSRVRLGLLLHFGPTPQFHRILNANV